MKKLLLISFSLLLAINYGLSQPQEYQWLIWNGNGKYGTSTPSFPPYTPYNNYITTITNQFNLGGVLSPTAGQTPAHKNDLLIIYSDYQHYNSRISSPTGIFFDGASGTTVMSHNFNTPTNKSVRYMYLTKRYEGDELPSGVRLSSSAGSGAYSIGTTTPSLLSANHDVVFGSDITLIINYGLIQDTIHGDKNLTLNFDGVLLPGQTVVTTNQNFLDLQPVFGTNMSDRKMAVYPNPSVDPGTLDVITLHPANEPFGYVNLRPNVNLNNYMPHPGVDTTKAVFTLKQGGTPIAQIRESIMLSHDPNFLQVDSICKTSDGGHIVYYRLQFENDGEADTKSYSAEVTFPLQFDLNCLVPRIWHGGGQPFLKGIMLKNGRTYTFPFINHVQLLKRSQPPHMRQGYVTFAVKVKPGIDVSDVGVSLKLINPTVIFDNFRYPLNVFYDLRVCNQDSSSNPSGSKLTHQIPKGKKENENVSTQQEEEFISEKDKEKSTSVILPESVGSHIYCYRPISSYPCECKKPFCWKCVFWGAAILGFALLLFSFRKKLRKPIPPKPPLSPIP